jgi:hypothetical protein
MAGITAHRRGESVSAVLEGRPIYHLATTD